MSLKSALSKPFAYFVYAKMRKRMNDPLGAQRTVFSRLLQKAGNTIFGKQHGFEKIKTTEDFSSALPVRDYEAFREYIDRIINGEKDVLWPGKPVCFAKTSGTTSGIKYIPLTGDSLPYHLQSARNALLCYIAQTGKTSFIDGKMIFLQGSPKMEKIGEIPMGRLSGLVANYVPRYLQRNRMPSYQTNCIEDWETKVRAIADETVNADMRLISGIPSWVQMYFDILLEKSGKKTIREIFPNFSLFVYGGLNFEPYRARFEKTIGARIDSIETYPASEGFIAFQDRQNENGLLLLLDSGIFYEFIPADDFFSSNPKRLWLKDVEIGVNYVLLLSTNAGLWAYNIGDTIKFVSKNPYRIIVTGRIKHFTSAFGEHVIAEEVEAAINEASTVSGAEITEFHVAPQITPPSASLGADPTGELPYHEWLIEFAKIPVSFDLFREKLDAAMQSRNVYYKDLIKGKVLQPLKITLIKKNGFIEFMKSKGRLGGQNKIQRLANDRCVAEELKKYNA